MKRQQRLLTITTLIAASFWGACGGGSSSPAPAPTAPTISAYAGNTAGTTTSVSLTPGTATNISPTQAQTLTFSTAMDATTVENAANVSMNCAGTVQGINFVTTDETAFTITPPSPAFPQATACTLSVGTGVENSAGTALATAASYAFTTGCTTDDNFSTDTLVTCWASIASPSGSMSIDNGTLNMTAPTIPTQGLIAQTKPLTVSGTPVLTVDVPTFSGLATSGVVGEACALTIYESSDPSNGVSVSVGAESGGHLAVDASNNGADPPPAYTHNIAVGTSSAALSGTLHLKLTQVSSTSYVASFSIGSGAETTSDPISVNTALTSPVAGIVASNKSGPDTVQCSFDNFKVTGATATGQDAGGL